MGVAAYDSRSCITTGCNISDADTSDSVNTVLLMKLPLYVAVSRNAKPFMRTAELLSYVNNASKWRFSLHIMR